MRRSLPNFYDIFSCIIVLSIMTMLLLGIHGLLQPWHAPANSHAESLQIKWLMYDSIRTNLRLLIGLLCSFIFAIGTGILAAKNKHAARLILPFINLMESVPLIGVMSISMAFFLTLFHYGVLSFECAAIFGVFTAQAWNMAFAIHQGLTTVPTQLNKLGKHLKLSAWRRFWIIELPTTLPALVWNTMVSQTAAWFALVGTEAMAVGSKTIMVPGIGSYIQSALDKHDPTAITYAIIAIALNVVIMDQLFFKPLVRFCERFRLEKNTKRQRSNSWFLNCLLKAHFLQKFIQTALSKLFQVINIVRLTTITAVFDWKPSKKTRRASVILYYLGIIFLVYISAVCLFPFLKDLSLAHWSNLMLRSALRISVAMLLSIAIFLPLGIWIGLSIRKTKLSGPVIQIMAALPPDVYYPALTLFLIATHQSLNLWSIPLIMVGCQWYILFNIIAGASAIPNHLLNVSRHFSLKGIYYWRRILLPAVFPYLITGIISAAGGAWNADVMAELVQWGSQYLQVTGMGATIAIAGNHQNTTTTTIGCIATCVLVGLCIIFIWRPLYHLAEKKYRLN